MAKACPTPRPFRSVAGTVSFLTLLFFLSFLTRFIFSPLLPAIGKDIGLGAGQAGSLFFMSGIGMLLGSLSTGFISARVTHRNTIFISVFGAAAGLLVAHFAGSIWMLRVALIMLGFFAGVQTPSSLATITAMVRPQDWSTALTVQQLGPPLSLVASGLFAAALLSWFSWRTSLLWIVGLCVLAGLLFIIFRGVGSFPGDPPIPSMLGPVVRLHSFWVMAFLFALGMAAQAGVYSMLPMYLTTERGMSVAGANTFLGLANIAPLIMLFIAGWVTDRIGEKWTMTFYLFVAGIGVLFTGLLSGVGMKISIVVVSAFAVGFFPPAFKSLSSIVQPTFRSLAASLGTPIGFILGGGLLPTGLGFMGQSYSFALGFAITGAVIAVGSVAALTLTFVEEFEPGC
jgi:NNP family nitrate/nitrite transporter-like MFS transporter